MKIFLLSILFIIPSFTQQDINHNIPDNDSLYIKIWLNPLTNLQINYNEFEVYHAIYEVNLGTLKNIDSQTIWLQTSLAVSSSMQSADKFSQDLLLPLEQKYYKDFQLNPLTYVLGMVQAGAVGYLAYKHIKKYGFLR